MSVVGTVEILVAFLSFPRDRQIPFHDFAIATGLLHVAEALLPHNRSSLAALLLRVNPDAVPGLKPICRYRVQYHPSNLPPQQSHQDGRVPYQTLGPSYHRKYHFHEPILRMLC